MPNPPADWPQDLADAALTGKPWWESATIRGLVTSVALTLASAGAAVLAKWGLPEDASYLIALSVVLTLLSLLGQGYAWWGRVRGPCAPIDRTAVLPGLIRHAPGAPR